MILYELLVGIPPFNAEHPLVGFCDMLVPDSEQQSKKLIDGSVLFSSPLLLLFQMIFPGVDSTSTPSHL